MMIDDVVPQRLQWKKDIAEAASLSRKEVLPPVKKLGEPVRPSFKPKSSTLPTSRQPQVDDAARTSAIDVDRKEPLTEEQSAIHLYGIAVLAERQGRVNDALRAYRSAFRKRDDVDKLYHLAQLKDGDKATSDHPENAADPLSFEFERTLQLEPDYEAATSKSKRLRGLYTSQYAARLKESFLEHPYDRDNPYDSRTEDVNQQLRQNADQGIRFHARSTLKSVPLAKLPDEIVVTILGHLASLSVNAKYPDVASFECGWALTCRKARLLSLEAAALWRNMCEGVYTSLAQLSGPSSARTLSADPAKKIDSSCAAICSNLYHGDWRLMWIEHPRIRCDGVYISQITYLRRGAHDGTTYYDPTHLVTYYRYLVFLPTGDVVSLLSHDVPSAVVPNLLSLGNTAKQAAGYTVGRWRILRKPIDNAFDKSTGQGPIVQLSSLEDPRTTDGRAVKYSFEMLCRLKSTSRGKMNKLEMLSLSTINRITQDRCDIPIRQANNALPNFYFSRVRSYD